MHTFKQSPYYFFGCRSLRLRIPCTEGNDVKVLQSLLNLLPDHIIPDAPPLDGVYGLSTRQAVKSFQRYFHLPCDGVTRADTYYYLGHRLAAYAYHDSVFSSRLLGIGSRGSDVAVLQNKLASFRQPFVNRPASGHFDHHTDTALRSFQNHFAELKADGIAGPETFDMLLRWSPLGGRVLKKGRHGLDTYWLQMLLYQLHYYNRTPDGFFDKRTEKSLISFQKDAGLPADGVVGPQTFLALGTTAPYPNHRYYYRVSAKDSISQVARLFNKKTEDIIKQNRLSSPGFQLEPGQLLRIPPPLTFHLAQKGETLDSISRRYAIPQTDLQRANPFFPATSLLPGEMVVLPRHRYDYQDSVLYLDHTYPSLQLQERSLVDSSCWTLLTGIPAPSRLTLSSDQRKAALFTPGDSHLLIYDRDTSVSRSLLTPLPIEHLAWSKDHRKLILNGSIVVPVNDTRIIQKLPGSLADWLPDSDTIICTHSHRLYKINTVSASSRELLSLPDESIYYFKLDKAGRQMVLFSNLRAGRTRLTYRLDMLTGSLSELSRNDHACAWSADGDLLLAGRCYYGEFHPWFYEEIRLGRDKSPGTESIFTAKRIELPADCFSADSRSFILLLGIPTYYYSLTEQPSDLFIKPINSPLITQVTANELISEPHWVKCCRC